MEQITSFGSYFRPFVSWKALLRGSAWPVLDLQNVLNVFTNTSFLVFIGLKIE